MNHYHYIFTGNGLSALLTLFEMIQAGRFSDKKILLYFNIYEKGKVLCPKGFSIKKLN